LFSLKTKIAEQMAKMPATIPTTTSMSEESDSYFLPLSWKTFSTRSATTPPA
jgi:hypothetical protein